MCCLRGRDCIYQIAGRIGLAVPLFDAVAEYPANLAADAMGGKSGSTPIYALQHDQYLRGVDFSDRALAEPWEYIVLHAGERLGMLRWLHARLALVHPAASDNLKRMGGCEQAGSFSAFFASPGSMPAASFSRASSRFFRAAANETSG